MRMMAGKARRALGAMVLAGTMSALTACGSNDETEAASGTYTDPETGKSADYSVKTDASGETSNVSIKTEDGTMNFGSGTANAKLPAGITAYPGTTMTSGMTANQDGKTGGMAGFEVKAPAAAVLAHYRKQAEAKGMKIAGEMTAGNTMMFAAESSGDGNDGFQVTVSEEGGVTTGSIVYGMQ